MDSSNSKPEQGSVSGEPASQSIPTISKKSVIAREFAKLGLYVAIFYLLGGLIIRFSPLYEFLVLRPQGKNELYNAKIDTKEEINFQNKNGDMLNAWYFKVPNAKRIVLINHGNAGNLINRLLIARDFLQLGVPSFVYDYRGYGASTGKPTAEGLLEDAESAYDYVNQKLGFQPEQIILYGESIGTGVTSRLAKERPYGGLILQSALTSLPNVARDGIIWLRAYPDWVFPKPHYDTISIISELKGPVLFIHGMKDATVPAKHAIKLHELAQSPKEIVLLPHAGHNDVQGEDEAQFFAALKKYLSENLQQTHTK